jgi:HSP20 family protein
MLMRFDPFRDLDPAQLFSSRASTARPFVMPMDAYRDGDQFVVLFDLPGVNPSGIDLTVEKNVLTVSAERSWQPQEGQEVVVNERPQGRFTRQLFLGENLDSERIQATYENGVLRIVIPVAEQAKPRRVEIATNDGGTTEVTNTGESSTQAANRKPVTAGSGASSSGTS